MSHTASITSAIKLSKTEQDSILSTLNLSAFEEVNFLVNPEIIGGLSVTIDGKTVDLTLKHQLAKISESELS